MRSLFGGKYALAALFTVALLTLVNGCAGETQGTFVEFEAEIARLQTAVDDLEAEIAGLKEEAGSEILFEEQYEAMLRELFSETELTRLALERGVTYSLKVNQAEVTGPEIAVTAGEMLSITLSEAMVMSRDDYHTLFPNKILQPVMLGGLQNHMEIVEANADYFGNPGAGTVVEGYGFFFENAGTGTIIKVKISEIIRERLGIAFNEFTVRVE